MTKKRTSPSPETQEEALRIARANQRPGQTKEQTRLIAQGIEKGIAQYKKQQKAKAREQDRAKKRQKHADPADSADTTPHVDEAAEQTRWLPWVLLILSWLGFSAYLMLS